MNPYRFNFVWDLFSDYGKLRIENWASYIRHCLDYFNYFFQINIIFVLTIEASFVENI